MTWKLFFLARLPRCQLLLPLAVGGKKTYQAGYVRVGQGKNQSLAPMVFIVSM